MIRNKLTKNFKIIAFDPGIVNMGMVIIQKNRSKSRIELAGLVEKPISDLTANFKEQALDFYSYIKGLIFKHKPSAIVMERFQNRGRFNGASGEKIGIMMGIVAALCIENCIQMIPVTASTWKNKLQYRGKRSIKDVYKLYKPFPAHIIDAYFIGIYGLYLEEKENPFDDWKLKQLEPLLKYWEKPKRKPRKKKNE